MRRKLTEYRYLILNYFHMLSSILKLLIVYIRKKLIIPLDLKFYSLDYVLQLIHEYYLLLF